MQSNKQLSLKPSIKKRLDYYNRERSKRWAEWRKAARDEAVADYSGMKCDLLFISGLMLYWGEGDSKMENGIVRLANTDPKMIGIFSRFLARVCKVPKDKMKLNVIGYPDMDAEESKAYWCRAAELPQEQFTKVQYIRGKHPSKRLKYGTCIIYCCSRQLKEKIHVWIHLAQQDLLNDSNKFLNV